MMRGWGRFLLKFLLISGAVFFSIPVLLFGGFFAYRIGGEYLLRTEFDAERWKAAAPSPRPYPPPDDVRIRMVDDLLNDHDLAGMTRAEVTALLGPSDEAATLPEERLLPGWDAVYYLGPERGLLGLDSEWLAIRFQSNRVVEHRIIIP